MSHPKIKKFHKTIQDKISGLEDLYEESSDLAKQAKIVVLIAELSEYERVFNINLKGHRPKRKSFSQENGEAEDRKSSKTVVANTNHPTYPLGHEAAEILTKGKHAIIDLDKAGLNKMINDFMAVEEITKKRTTEESYSVIHNYARNAWESYELLSDEAKKNISLEDWLNDADGNSNKTLAALKEGLVNSNKLFQELLLGDLKKIVNTDPSLQAKLEGLIDDVKNFDISENNFLDSKDISKKIRQIIDDKNLANKAKKQLEGFADKVDFFESFVTKPQTRQEGSLFKDAYDLVEQKLVDLGIAKEGEALNFEEYKFSLNKNGDVVVEHGSKTNTIFKASEFTQKVDKETGKRLPLPKDGIEVTKDHFAKLVYLSSQKDLPIKTFIMSEFGGGERFSGDDEMAAALKSFKLLGIDTKDIKLFPLYEKIENYETSTLSNVLTRGKNGDADLSENEKLIKSYIDETGTLRVMFAASDTTKRGGVMSYSKMLHELADLCDALAEYNKDIPSGQKIKLSFFWGGGPDGARGGAINFIRNAKSIAGSRGIELELSYTNQGQMVVRNSDPMTFVAGVNSVSQEADYQVNRKRVKNEKEYIESNIGKNKDIWEKLSKVFKVLGGDLSSEDYDSAYRNFAEEDLTNKNPLLSLSNSIAALGNTGDRASKRGENPEGTAFLEFLRAIGYDHGAKIVGFNNTILGHKERLDIFFGELGDESKQAEMSVKDLNKLNEVSVTFQGQIKTIEKIIESTDLEFLERIGKILMEKDSKKFAGVGDFIKKVKDNTQAMAKFAAISTGKAVLSTTPEEAYNMLRENGSKHLDKKNVERSKDLMADLIEKIAGQELQVDNLGGAKGVIAAFIHTNRPDWALEPTLAQKRETLIGLVNRSQDRGL